MQKTMLQHFNRLSEDDAHCAINSHSKQMANELQLTAYELLDDKLKARSSTLKVLVLRFSTSFDDRKPSKPCVN